MLTNDVNIHFIIIVCIIKIVVHNLFLFILLSQKIEAKFVLTV